MFQLRTPVFAPSVSGDRELNTLAGSDIGLDGGPGGVNREEHADSENETEKEIEAGVGQLSTDGLDAHLGDRCRALDASEPVPVATTDLIPLAGRANDRMLEANSKSAQLVTWEWGSWNEPQDDRRIRSEEYRHSDRMPSKSRSCWCWSRS